MPGKLIDLERRAYVIAGAGGGGTGTAICALLAEANATVVAVDRDEAGRASVAEALAPHGTHHLILNADLTDVASVEAMLAEAGKAGPIRGAVNVVGGMLPSHWQPLADKLAVDAFEDAVRFNLRPALVTSSAVARAVKAHGLGGSIVHIGSAAGLVSNAYGAGYGAAKAALINLARSMAVEWGQYQLRVNVVAPGTVRARKMGRARFDTVEDDAMRQRTRDVIPLGRRGVPEDVAGAVLYLMSDLAAYVTGQTIVIDGGALARAPYTDGDNMPVFVTDPALRQRLKD
jgi:NAD(P)-dependent dehydrogenase (short-subunit alcohol dehydrogenase family)